MIILKDITIKNFLSHENTKMNFPLGVIVLVGPNGSGKTAIMDAIMHSLLGFRGVRSRASSVDDLIRFGAKSMELELNFEADGREYNLNWRRERGGEVNARLQCKGVGLITDSATKTVQEVLKIIGIDKDTLLSSVFIRQGEITNLIEEEPSKRKEVIGRILGLDRYEKAYEKMREIISKLKDIKGSYQNEVNKINGLIEASKKQLDKLSQDIVAQQNELMKLKEELNSKLVKLNSIRIEKEILDGMQKKYDELYKRKERIEGDMKFIEKSIKELKDKQTECANAKNRIEVLKYEISKIPLLERYIEIYHEMEKLNVDMINLNEDMNKLKELEDYEKQLAEVLSKVLKYLPEPSMEVLRREIETLQNSENIIQNEMNEKQRKRGEWIGKINELKGHIEHIEELDICPVCKTKLSHTHKERVKTEISMEIQKFELELKGLEEQIQSLSKNLEEIRSKIKILSDITSEVGHIENLKKLISKVRSDLTRSIPEISNPNFKVEDAKLILTSKLENLKLKLNAYESELNNIVKSLGYKPKDPKNELESLKIKRDEYNDLRVKAERYDEYLKQIDNLNSELEKLRSEYSTVESELKNLGYDAKKHEEVNQEFLKLTGKYNELKGKAAQIENDIENYNKKLNGLKSEIEKLRNDRENINAKLERIEYALKVIEIIRGVFSKDGIQKLIRQRITPLISQLATNYIDQFNLDITGISVDEDLEIKVAKGGDFMPLQLLSGGEKVAVAIALRLALARALAERFSTVIMDEPTVHLDEERRRVLIDVFKNFRESAITQQMIIITHDRELEEVADTVYQVNKISGVSKVSEVRL
jgi:exonuclease SbcC